MTVVKIANNSSDSQGRIENPNLFPEDTLYGKLKVCGEVETDQESTGSSEDMDSPRSVAKVRRWPGGTKEGSLRVHNQILRIREEDLHIGDGIGEGTLSTKDKIDGGHRVHVVVFQRPILPASPLGGKSTVKMVH